MILFAIVLTRVISLLAVNSEARCPFCVPCATSQARGAFGALRDDDNTVTRKQQRCVVLAPRSENQIENVCAENGKVRFSVSVSVAFVFGAKSRK